MEQAAADFAVLAGQIQSVPQLWQALCSALVSAGNKKSILRAFYGAAQTQPGELAERFLDLLIVKKRFHLLPFIAERLKDETAAGAGKAKAIIRSAFPLTPEQLKKIEQSVSHFLKKTVAAENVVQQDLLAGTLVQVGDFVMDNSLKSRLKKLEQELQSS